MATERQLVDAYTRRALQRVRVGNGWSRDAQHDLRELANELRALLAGVDLSAIGRRDMVALLRDIEAAIVGRYTALSDRLADDLAELTAIESAWATRTADLPRPASMTALAAASAGLLVVGLPVARQWQRQSTNLTDRITAVVRTAAATGQAPPDTLAAILGSGPRGREKGGLMNAARTQADTLIQTSAHSAAYAGQMAAWKSGGINALKWHSILDTRTTTHCATRAGKLYTLDLEPIGHDIPIEALPPAHWNCRSLLVPMQYPGEIPPSGEDPYTESFDAWLKRHPPEVQDEMLGQGRAALWRSGTITTRDLLGQAGETLSLAELTVLHPVSAYDVAKAGGRHSGYLKERLGYTDTQLSRAYKSARNAIANHEQWIAAPYTKLPTNYPVLKVRHLQGRKWPADIRRIGQQLEIIEQIMKGRGLL